MASSSLVPARTTIEQIGTACVVLGAASIVGSVATWAAAKGPTAEERAHAERFGIFIGLWAPTFFVLAGLFSRGAAAPAAAPALPAD